MFPIINPAALALPAVLCTIAICLTTGYCVHTIVAGLIYGKYYDLMGTFVQRSPDGTSTVFPDPTTIAKPDEFAIRKSPRPTRLSDIV